MPTITTIQQRLKAWLYDYGLNATARETGLSKYHINKCVYHPDASMRRVEQLVKHFEYKDTEAERRKLVSTR